MFYTPDICLTDTRTLQNMWDVFFIHSTFDLHVHVLVAAPADWQLSSSSCSSSFSCFIPGRIIDLQLTWVIVVCGCTYSVDVWLSWNVHLKWLYRLLLINWLWIAKCLNVRICCWPLSFQALNQESLGFWLLAIYRLHFRLWEAGINIFHIC